MQGMHRARHGQLSLMSRSSRSEPAYNVFISPNFTSMATTVCKFCLQPRQLVEAHIIPKALYPRNPSGDRRHISLDGTGQKPPRTIPNGVYDSNLVCDDCERRFGPWDDYASDVIAHESVTFACLRSQQGTPYRVYPTVDYAKLKLFFISLLWRAHATDLKDCNRVDLGPKYAALAKRMIENSDPGTPDQFAVVLVRLLGEHRHMGAPPTPRRIENVLLYETLLFGFAAYVKVDSRPLPGYFRQGQLEHGKPLLVLEKPITDGPFLGFAVDAYRDWLAAKERLRMDRKQAVQT